MDILDILQDCRLATLRRENVLDAIAEIIRLRDRLSRISRLGLGVARPTMNDCTDLLAEIFTIARGDEEGEQ